MKSYLIAAFLLLSVFAYGQHKCDCAINPNIKEYIHCKTRQLKNGGKLYYQFTCDSIWLTYENSKGHKVILYSDDTTMYYYNFRLGFQFAKEYNRGILFRSGCPANGSCNFVLIDKQTGKWLKEYGELIYDHSTNTFYDFIVYFSNDELNSLTIDFIDNHKKYNVKINPDHFIDAVIPQYVFNAIMLKNNILTLSYKYNKQGKTLTNNIVVDIGKLKSGG